MTGAEISASTPQPSSAKWSGRCQNGPQQRHVQGEFHGVVPVLPMVLEEPGEADLLGKLKQH
jgi:hypothetical protein